MTRKNWRIAKGEYNTNFFFLGGGMIFERPLGNSSVCNAQKTQMNRNEATLSSDNNFLNYKVP